MDNFNSNSKEISQLHMSFLCSKVFLALVFCQTQAGVGIAGARHQWWWRDRHWWPCSNVTCLKIRPQLHHPLCVMVTSWFGVCCLLTHGLHYEQVEHCLTGIQGVKFHLYVWPNCRETARWLGTWQLSWTSLQSYRSRCSAKLRNKTDLLCPVAH